MKKVIMYLSILVLVLAFVSCDSEVFNKLTDAMGIMNENVYGLEPNLEAVDDAIEEATSGVEVTVGEDGSTTADELVVPEGSSLAAEVGLTDDELDDSGVDEADPVADLDFSEENAEKVHEGVASVVNSPGAKEAFIEELKEPVADGNPAAVSNALKIQKEKIKKAVTDLGGTGADVLGSLDSIIIPTSPTKGDMMVIQVLANLAKKTSDRAGILTSGTDEEKQAAEEEILEEALKTLETLKTIGKASSIDLMSIFDIDALLDRSTSRDAAEDTFLTSIKNSVGSLIDQIVLVSGVSDAAFTEENISQMINDFTGLRFGFEMAAYAKNPVSWDASVDPAVNIEKLFNYEDFTKSGDGELELQDILLYGISVGITDLYERMGENDFVEFFNDLVDNKDELQAAILSGEEGEIPEEIKTKIDSIVSTYEGVFNSPTETDVEKVFNIANTLLYMKWESGTATPFDGDIEGSLEDLFGGEDD